MKLELSTLRDLGHKIRYETVKMGNSKKIVISTWPTPMYIKEL